jgi:hypothetical protein
LHSLCSKVKKVIEFAAVINKYQGHRDEILKAVWPVSVQNLTYEVMIAMNLFRYLVEFAGQGIGLGSSYCQVYE